MTSPDLQGTVAVVTGASSGLGLATTMALLRKGVRVVGADMNPPAETNDAVFVCCDVTDEDSVQAVFDQAAQQDGLLRSIVNCAGIRSATRVLEAGEPHPLEVFRRVVDVNLTGTFNVMRLGAAAMAALPAAEDGARGAVVNTASVAAYEGLPGQAAYAASKAAVAGMTIAVARDLADSGIRVNAIAPGVIDSPLLDQLPAERRQRLAAGVVFPSRLGRPEEFADLAIFLLENRYMNGETVRLDGALRMSHGS